MTPQETPYNETIETLRLLQQCRVRADYGGPGYSLLTNSIDVLIGMWPLQGPIMSESTWQLAMSHLERSKQWRDAIDGGWMDVS